eukprot:94348-Amphidinium_carterae.1
MPEYLVVERRSEWPVKVAAGEDGGWYPHEGSVPSWEAHEQEVRRRFGSFHKVEKDAMILQENTDGRNLGCPPERACGKIDEEKTAVDSSGADHVDMVTSKESAVASAERSDEEKAEAPLEVNLTVPPKVAA